MGKRLLRVVVCLIVLLIVGIAALYLMENKSKRDGKPSIVTIATKAAPTLTCEQGFTDVKFYVTANDNYEEVDVTFKILDGNGAVVYTQTLQGFNYAKGNTYMLSQSLTFTQILSIDKIEYRISYYR